MFVVLLVEWQDRLGNIEGIARLAGLCGSECSRAALTDAKLISDGWGKSLQAIQFEATVLIVGGSAQQSLDFVSDMLREGVTYLSTGPFKVAIELSGTVADAYQNAVDYSYIGSSVSCSTNSRSCGVYIGFVDD